LPTQLLLKTTKKKRSRFFNRVKKRSRFFNRVKKIGRS
jgi:hypothetical protein